MASLHKQKKKRGESWRIQFTDENGKRKSIWLGSMAKKTAETILSHIEHIIVCQRTGVSVSPEAATWIGKLSKELHEKMAVVPSDGICSDMGMEVAHRALAFRRAETCQ
jgi:hypothetical protein